MAATSSVPVVPVTAAGVPVTLGATGFGTLADATTYFYDLGENVAGASVVCAQLQAAGTTLVATITLETTVYPADLASAFDVVVGTWHKENPPDAYVPVTGAGWVATAATVAVAGGAAGGCLYNLNSEGGRRVRLKVAVTTGDSVRVGSQAKA